jgi:pilus assembly protein CpaE
MGKDDMMAEKILIVDDDLDTLKLVGLMLQKQGYQIVAATNGSQGIAHAEAENPDLVLLDVMMPEMDGFEVAKRLRANSFTADIPILMFTAKTQLDDKVSGFESGADDYLTKPTHPTELIAHVKALLARSTKRRLPGASAQVEKHAFIVGVISARGGFGVTTVAVNLGSAIQHAKKSEVIVAELQAGMGSLGPDLGIPDPMGLTHLLRLPEVDITRQKVKDELITHSSGLHILASSIHPRDALLLENPAHVEMIINRLSFLAPYVILDLGAGLSKLNLALVKLCDQLIVILEPVQNTIMHTRAMISDLVDLGINPRVIHAVIVNRIRSDTQMNWTAVQDKLGHPVPVAITPAPELIYQAVRMKNITASSDPNSLTGQQFTRMAALLLDIEKQQT